MVYCRVDRPQVRRHPAEDHVREHAGDRMERAVAGPDAGPRVLGHPDRVVDAVGEADVAVVLPCQPQLEHVDTAGALEGAVTRVVVGVELVRLEEVVGLPGEVARRFPGWRRRLLIPRRAKRRGLFFAKAIGQRFATP